MRQLAAGIDILSAFPVLTLRTVFGAAVERVSRFVVPGNKSNGASFGLCTMVERVSRFIVPGNPFYRSEAVGRGSLAHYHF
ncbi:MAG: hypothetical protein MUF71_19575 [Candidatus Kapabacteria bacterium]|nr:hypothetical protein [Candidatus Kapabacteria bacterium]